MWTCFSTKFKLKGIKKSCVNWIMMNMIQFPILKKSILFLQLEMKVINHSCEKKVPRNPGTQVPRYPGTQMPRYPERKKQSEGEIWHLPHSQRSFLFVINYWTLSSTANICTIPKTFRVQSRPKNLNFETNLALFCSI